MRARIAMVNNESSSLVRFSTLGKKILVYHSELTVLRCSSGTVATLTVLQKKQATICLEVFLPATAFIGFGSGSKTHTLDSCFVLGSYAQINDSSAVTIFIVFLQHFFKPIDSNLLLSVCLIVRHPTRTNLFYG